MVGYSSDCVFLWEMGLKSLVFIFCSIHFSLLINEIRPIGNYFVGNNQNSKHLKGNFFFFFFITAANILSAGNSHALVRDHQQLQMRFSLNSHLCYTADRSIRECAVKRPWDGGGGCLPTCNCYVPEKLNPFIYSPTPKSMFAKVKGKKPRNRLLCMRCFNGSEGLISLLHVTIQSKVLSSNRPRVI